MVWFEDQQHTFEGLASEIQAPLLPAPPSLAGWAGTQLKHACFRPIIPHQAESSLTSSGWGRAQGRQQCPPPLSRSIFPPAEP